MGAVIEPTFEFPCTSLPWMPCQVLVVCTFWRQPFFGEFLWLPQLYMSSPFAILFGAAIKIGRQGLLIRNIAQGLDGHVICIEEAISTSQANIGLIRHEVVQTQKRSDRTQHNTFKSSKLCLHKRLPFCTQCHCRQHATLWNMG